MTPPVIDWARFAAGPEGVAREIGAARRGHAGRDRRGRAYRLRLGHAPAHGGGAGLQIRPRGAGWTGVAHVPGAFVVNIGDCLMRWTNDTYVSTPHRVLPPERARRSVAFFLDPDPDARIAPLPGTGVPRYPPVTGAYDLRGRLAATYGGAGSA
jgi:hypothetical protein